MKENYYAQNLNAQKLYQVYQTKYARVRQYLESEISFVRNYLHGTEHVLELGAGYVRIVKELAPSCKSIVGIDISKDNVEFGKEYLKDTPNAQLMVMDVHIAWFQEQSEKGLLGEIDMEKTKDGIIIVVSVEPNHVVCLNNIYML